MARGGLARVAGDFIAFVQIIQTNPREALTAVPALRSRLLSLLEQVSKAASTQDVSQEEIEEARFALVAWADEAVLRADWPGRDQWHREPLQTELYRTTRAGNEFFEHLARLKPDQLAAREIYFLVLALGFEGQYAGQEDQRRALIAHQYETLRAAGRTLELPRARPLAPAAYDLEIDLPPAGRGVAVWVGLVALGALAIYGVLWVVLRYTAPEVPLPPGS